MLIRCAWCHRQIGEDPRLTWESHGICSECAQTLDGGLVAEDPTTLQPPRLRSDRGRGPLGA